MPLYDVRLWTLADLETTFLHTPLPQAKKGLATGTGTGTRTNTGAVPLPHRLLCQAATSRVDLARLEAVQVAIGLLAARRGAAVERSRDAAHTITDDRSSGPDLVLLSSSGWEAANRNVPRQAATAVATAVPAPLPIPTAGSRAGRLPPPQSIEPSPAPTPAPTHWCLHPSCAESTDWFATEIALAAHEHTAHTQRLSSSTTATAPPPAPPAPCPSTPAAGTATPAAGTATPAAGTGGALAVVAVAHRLDAHQWGDGTRTGPVLVLVGLKYRGNVGAIVRAAVQADLFAEVHIVDSLSPATATGSDSGPTSGRRSNTGDALARAPAGAPAKPATDRRHHDRGRVSDEDILYYSLGNAPLLRIRRFGDCATYLAATALERLGRTMVAVDGGTTWFGDPHSLHSVEGVAAVQQCGYLLMGAEDRGVPDHVLRHCVRAFYFHSTCDVWWLFLPHTSPTCSFLVAQNALTFWSPKRPLHPMCAVRAVPLGLYLTATRCGAQPPIGIGRVGSGMHLLLCFNHPYCSEPRKPHCLNSRAF
jgi:tRNA(Leu) C34 or U34 (ribose-2'-O)-methylase TrmL